MNEKVEKTELDNMDLLTKSNTVIEILVKLLNDI
jgi:hypothetical protein